MKRRFITFLIIISFIAPSIHFIEHNHSYNPFDKKLEHTENTGQLQCKGHCSESSEIEKLNSIKFKTDICQVNLFTSLFKNNYYSPIVKTKNIKKYVYKSNIYKKIITVNKAIFIAPKNSPPYQIA